MIRPATLAELRARPQLIAAAAAATDIGGEGGIDVQWNQLGPLEDVGALVVLAVDVAGEIVGYVCAAVVPEFFRPITSCTTLSLFLQPRHRWRWGVRLILELARAADARGAAKVRLQVLLSTRLQFLATRLGFEASCLVFEVAPRDLIMQYTARHGAGGGGTGGARIQRLRGRDAAIGGGEGPPRGPGCPKGR